MATTLKKVVHVEIILKDEALIHDEKEFLALITKKLQITHPILTEMEVSIPGLREIGEVIERMSITDVGPSRSVPFWDAELFLHVYKLIDGSAEKDYLDGDDDLAACLQTELPSRELHGLWDSIIVEDHIKRTLCGYCASTIQFSGANIDPTIISWNRIILLHGPPGTGKTSLCRSLAQKTFIRHNDRYATSLLLEISSHSLFSKYFSESGKKVVKLFDHIMEAAEDEDCLVFVLIDEVESIVSSRSASSSSSEPGDAVRVVNAVLTCLDQLKLLRNVLVLCTSNMISSIDAAFLDRVDLRMYIGPPSLQARYDILRSCLVELMNKGMIRPIEEIEEFNDTLSKEANDITPLRCSGFKSQALAPHVKLSALAAIAEGFSGRSLRKLPLKAHAYFLQRPAVSLSEYLRAIKDTLKMINGQEDST